MTGLLKGFLKIVFRAALPPIIGLAICFAILRFFPDISDEGFMIAMLFAFLIPQAVMAKE